MLVKRLPHKREDWSLILGIHIKIPSMAGAAYEFNGREAETRGMLKALWLTKLR